MRVRTTIKVLSGVITLLVVQSSVNAQTKIVDTIGNGAKWNIGQARTNGAPIGYDPGGFLAPAAPQNAAYAVLPFTINFTGAAFPSEVDIALNIQGPTFGVNSNVPALSGAIVQAPASNSLSATGLTAADFFSFDTSVNQPTSNIPNSGDGTTHLYRAQNLSGYTLTTGNTYWLVIAPKKGLNAQAGDTLLDYGIWNYRTAKDISDSGASLSNGLTTVGQGLAESQGANPGDTLTGTTVGRVPQTSYFGATILAPTVPEPSSVLALAGGVLMTGGFLSRRRK